MKPNNSPPLRRKASRQSTGASPKKAILNKIQASEIQNSPPKVFDFEPKNEISLQSSKQTIKIVHDDSRFTPSINDISRNKKSHEKNTSNRQSLIEAGDGNDQNQTEHEGMNKNVSPSKSSKVLTNEESRFKRETQITVAVASAPSPAKLDQRQSKNIVPLLTKINTVTNSPDKNISKSPMHRPGKNLAQGRGILGQDVRQQTSISSCDRSIGKSNLFDQEFDKIPSQVPSHKNLDSMPSSKQVVYSQQASTHREHCQQQNRVTECLTMNTHQSDTNQETPVDLQLLNSQEYKTQPLQFEEVPIMNPDLRQRNQIRSSKRQSNPKQLIQEHPDQLHFDQDQNQQLPPYFSAASQAQFNSPTSIFNPNTGNNIPYGQAHQFEKQQSKSKSHVEIKVTPYNLVCLENYLGGLSRKRERKNVEVQTTGVRIWHDVVEWIREAEDNGLNVHNFQNLIDKLKAAVATWFNQDEEQQFKSNIEPFSEPGSTIGKFRSQLSFINNLSSRQSRLENSQSKSRHQSAYLRKNTSFNQLSNLREQNKRKSNQIRGWQLTMKQSEDEMCPKLAKQARNSNESNRLITEPTSSPSQFIQSHRVNNKVPLYSNNCTPALNSGQSLHKLSKDLLKNAVGYIRTPQARPCTGKVLAHTKNLIYSLREPDPNIDFPPNNTVVSLNSPRKQNQQNQQASSIDSRNLQNSQQYQNNSAQSSGQNALQIQHSNAQPQSARKNIGIIRKGTNTRAYVNPDEGESAQTQKLKSVVMKNRTQIQLFQPKNSQNRDYSNQEPPLALGIEKTNSNVNSPRIYDQNGFLQPQFT